MKLQQRSILFQVLTFLILLFPLHTGHTETDAAMGDMTAALQRIEKQLLRLSEKKEENYKTSKSKNTSTQSNPAKKKQPLNEKDVSLEHRFQTLEKHIAALEKDLQRISSIIEKKEPRAKNQPQKSASKAEGNEENKNAPLAPKEVEKKVPVLPGKPIQEKEPLEMLPLPIEKKADKIVQNSFEESDVSFSPKDDVEAYNLIQKTIRENKLSIAIEQIEKFLQKFPDSSLKPNLLYWAGEISRTQQEQERAASYFLSVYTQYPSHQKAPESLLKLALTLKDLGKISEAKSTLKRLTTEYPHLDNNLLIIIKNLQDQLSQG